MAGGGLKCNIITVSLVTIGTVIAIFFLISVVVITGRSFIPEVCESYADDMKVTQYGIVIEIQTPFPKPRLFSWKFDVNGSLGKIEEKPYTVKQNKRKFLESCLDSISRVVPRDQHGSTEVVLLATDEIEAVELQANLDEVRVLLSSYAFNTSSDTVEPHVMTANDIARHRWTHENELLGTIKSDIDSKQYKLTKKDRTKLTYGLLEVTHSSARITYEVLTDDGNSSFTTNEDVELLELYAEEYSVFTQSIPCYGLRAAYRGFQHQLIDQMIDSTDTIANPCTPPGYQETIRSSDLHKRSSCVIQSTSTNNGWTNGVINASISRQSSQPELYRLEGTGDAKACESEVKRPSGRRELQPVPRGKFMAFFPYFLVDLSHSTDLTNSRDQCDWTHMPANMFGTEVNITGMNPCFVANYLHSLVFDDLEIDRKTWDGVIMHEDNRLDHRWIYGFVTSVVSSLPPPTFACVLVPDPNLVQRKQHIVTVLTVVMIFGFVLVALGYGFACQRGDDNEWVGSPVSIFEQV